jgi:hypothetical protein
MDKSCITNHTIRKTFLASKFPLCMTHLSYGLLTGFLSQTDSMLLATVINEKLLITVTETTTSSSLDTSFTLESGDS